MLLGFFLTIFWFTFDFMYVRKSFQWRLESLWRCLSFSCSWLFLLYYLLSTFFAIIFIVLAKFGFLSDFGPIFLSFLRKDPKSPGFENSRLPLSAIGMHFKTNMKEDWVSTEIILEMQLIACWNCHQHRIYSLNEAAFLTVVYSWMFLEEQRHYGSLERSSKDNHTLNSLLSWNYCRRPPLPLPPIHHHMSLILTLARVYFSNRICSVTIWKSNDCWWRLQSISGIH